MNHFFREEADQSKQDSDWDGFVLGYLYRSGDARDEAVFLGFNVGYRTLYSDVTSLWTLLQPLNAVLLEVLHLRKHPIAEEVNSLSKISYHMTCSPVHANRANERMKYAIDCLLFSKPVMSSDVRS